MATNWQQRLDDLARRREAKAKAKAKAKTKAKAKGRPKAKARPNQPAPGDRGLGSLRNPIRLDSEERVAGVRRRDAEARERASRPAPQGPGFGSLAPLVHPWVTPNRSGNAPAGVERGLGPPPLRRGIGPRDLHGPGAIVIDLDDDDAPLHSGDRARRQSRFGFPGSRDEVIDLEADEDPPIGNRGGRKVRFAPPGPVKEVIDVEARVGAKKGILRPDHPFGKKTRRAPALHDRIEDFFNGMNELVQAASRPLPAQTGRAKEVIDIDAGEGRSSSRPGVGDADSEIARAARERARQLERAILGDQARGLWDTGAGQRAGRRGVQVHSVQPIPQRFEHHLQRRRLEGKEGLSPAVLYYYRNELMRRDSRNVAGRFGQPSLVEEVLRENALERLRGGTGPGWRPVRQLGRGGQGGVTLWEMNRPDGSVLQLATKDMGFERLFFQDYNAEGNITRRLNEIGCENVLRVLEWAVLENPRPRFRIAYEVAEYGDLDHLLLWYLKHRLVLPEPFIWHVWHSLANALTYQALGHNESAEPLPEWEEILHGDIKPPNILLCAPDPHAPSTPHAQYPAVKLADYGCAFTIPLDRPDVRAFKSTYCYGTFGYRAPEVKPPRIKRRDDDDDDDDDVDELPYDQHGAHTDVWSLACTVQQLLTPAMVRCGDDGSRGLHVFDPYSARLKELIKACMRKDGRARPSSYDLFVETGREVRRGREAFEAGVRTAESGGADHGIYPDKVLFGKEEQRRFQTDMAYREAYKKVNLKWVYEQRPPPPPPPPPADAGG